MSGESIKRGEVIRLCGLGVVEEQVNEQVDEKVDGRRIGRERMTDLGLGVLGHLERGRDRYQQVERRG